MGFALTNERSEDYDLTLCVETKFSPQTRTACMHSCKGNLLAHLTGGYNEEVELRKSWKSRGLGH